MNPEKNINRCIMNIIGPFSKKHGDFDDDVFLVWQNVALTTPTTSILMSDNVDNTRDFSRN